MLSDIVQTEIFRNLEIMLETTNKFEVQHIAEDSTSVLHAIERDIQSGSIPKQLIEKNIISTIFPRQINPELVRSIFDMLQSRDIELIPDSYYSIQDKNKQFHVLQQIVLGKAPDIAISSIQRQSQLLNNNFNSEEPDLKNRAFDLEILNRLFNARLIEENKELISQTTRKTVIKLANYARKDFGRLAYFYYTILQCILAKYFIKVSEYQTGFDFLCKSLKEYTETSNSPLELLDVCIFSLECVPLPSNQMQQILLTDIMLYIEESIRENKETYKNPTFAKKTTDYIRNIAHLAIQQSLNISSENQKERERVPSYLKPQ